MVAMSFLWQRLELQYHHSLWVVMEIAPSKVSNASTGHLTGFFGQNGMVLGTHHMIWDCILFPHSV